MRFVPFFFDGNQWFGVVDSDEKWFELLGAYPEVDTILDAKMAPQSELNELPENYHFGAPSVRTGRMPSFGFRREHTPGTVRLEDWAKTRGMNLPTLSDKKPRA